MIGVVWYAASGFLYFEQQVHPDLGWDDAIWYSLVTMTTVGYGDLFPETTGGRFLIAVPTMVIGIGLLGFILGELTTSFIDHRSRKVKGLLKLNLSNHIIITPYTGKDRLLNMISELRCDPFTATADICVIDPDLEALPQMLNDRSLHFVSGSAVSEGGLEKAAAADARFMVLMHNPANPESDSHNLAACVIMRSLNKEARIIAECSKIENKRSLQLAGASSVVCLNELSTNLLVQELQDPGVQEIFYDLASNESSQQVYFTPIESMQSWTFGELKTWAGEDNRRAIAIGVKLNDEVIINPPDSMDISGATRAVFLAAERPPWVKL